MKKIYKKKPCVLYMIIVRETILDIKKYYETIKKFPMKIIGLIKYTTKRG